METKTTINAYVLIGMSSKSKVASMLNTSVPTLRQKLNGSISWTLDDAENIDLPLRQVKSMKDINDLVRLLNKA